VNSLSQTLLMPAGAIDHTCLKSDATSAEIERLCEEAVEYGFASVCVPPRLVARAARTLYGSEVAVGTVVGFPLGYQLPAVKAFEAELAVRDGASEVDMVIALGAAREGLFDQVRDDIRAVVDAVPGALVKVILECCQFDDGVKRRLVESVAEAGGHYVKTSTGFAASGASLADVRLMVAAAAGRVKVKAAGGIRSWPDCRDLLAAGADRIGTSAGVAIIEAWRKDAMRS